MEKTITGSEVQNKSTKNEQGTTSSEQGTEWTSVADTLKRNETPQIQENNNVSKDFLPKRTQSYTDTWKKKAEEQEKNQKNQGGSIYGYTPFTKPISSNATFNPNSLPDTIYGVRPGSAIPRAQVTNNGRVPVTMINSRPGSALDNIYGSNMPRPDSRAGSEYGMPRIGSRYQSYTTLPRPEQLDGEHLNNNYNNNSYNIYGTAQQIYGTGPRGRQLNGMDNIYGLHASNMMKNATMSRPTSAMSTMMIPNGYSKAAYLNPGFSVSNIYMGQPATTTIPSKSGPLMVSSESMSYKSKGKLINNSGLSVCSSMQVVSGLCFLGIGIARIVLNAKWAFGIEVMFGFLVILSGLLGVIGLRNKNYSCSVASFILSNANTYFVIIPFLIGLIPLLPFHIRSDTFVVLIGNDEPIEVDIALTVLCIVQFFLSLTTSIFGCRSWGSTMHHVEHLRLRDVIREVYPGNINRH
uniref:MARVEL domain-containing protein n=1 Tax=Parastrongyloides trichosuri TaxID=131310 RepID=A0A0N4ZK75_PARTI